MKLFISHVIFLRKSCMITKNLVIYIVATLIKFKVKITNINVKREMWVSIKLTFIVHQQIIRNE